MPLMALSTPTPFGCQTISQPTSINEILTNEECYSLTPGDPLIPEYASAAQAALSSFEFPTSKLVPRFQPSLTR